MDMVLTNAWAFCGIALGLVILMLIPILFEAWRIVCNARMIADRVALLTDIRGWVELFSGFRSGRRKRS